MQARLFIHAVNIHVGGGAFLLLSLLEALDGEIEVYLQVDSRMELGKLPATITVHYVKPTLFHRLNSEINLFNNTTKKDILLCFGNLPPLFENKAKVILFLQNRFLLGTVSLRGFSLSGRIRIMMERLWLKYFHCHVNQFIVQSPTMEHLLKSCLNRDINVRILPFVNSLINKQDFFASSCDLVDGKKYDFIYPASGEPHKNHHQLIEAWCLLAEEGIMPHLCLMLDEVKFKFLLGWVRLKQKEFCLKITNITTNEAKDLLSIYSHAKAMIYPSLMESFGLPLVTAREMKIPVIASELDYVRDILNPQQTFDPNSSISIARAVKRFLNQDEEKLKILSSRDFLNCIYEEKDI